MQAVARQFYIPFELQKTKLTVQRYTHVSTRWFRSLKLDSLSISLEFLFK